MKHNLVITSAHAVDILGNVVGRDQHIMTIAKACKLVSILSRDDFIDDEVIFFDPFCKAGELMLACAFHSCWYKCSQGKQPFNLELVKNELYESNRYYGLAPDERHYRLSLRTFLGNENSHNKKYNKIIRDGNYLSEIDGRLDLSKFKAELETMIEYIKATSKARKIIAIGNPPYQESDGGYGKSAKSIYDLFVQSLIDSKEVSEFIFVIPARWFGGGKGLDEFRLQMMRSKKIKNLKYFKNSSEIFPTVDINGGVCFLHYDKEYSGLTTFSDGNYQDLLSLDEFDIITDDPKGYQIIRKIQKFWNKNYIGSVAWSRKPFGLPTNFFDKNDSMLPSDKNVIPCLARNKKIKYLNRKLVIKNINHIDRWKVSVPRVAGGSKGNRRSTIPVNQIFLIPKGTISTETYSVIDTFETKEQAENLITYLKTDFARYLLGLRKITQDIPKDRWNWVPYVDVSKKWTDTELFNYFNITKEERTHITNKVKEWS